MDKEFKLPELGENIETAQIVNVLVKEGDYVEKDQTVIEIETDKATIEVPSSIEGKITKVNVKSGDTVRVGAVIILVSEKTGQDEIKQSEKTPEIINTNVKDSEQPIKSTQNVEPKIVEEKKSVEQKEETKNIVSSTNKVELKLPELGENIDSAQVVNVLVKIGDIIEKDQGVIEIETDKATIEVPSTLAGKVLEVIAKPNGTIKVGETILVVEAAAVETKKEIKVISEVEKPLKEEKGIDAKEELKFDEKRNKGQKEKLEPGEINNQPPILENSAPAAPSVRRIAREIGVNINKVKGTGIGGRISMEDVKEFSKKMHEEREAQIVSGSVEGLRITKENLPDFSKYGPITTQPMSNIRIKTATHLTYAWNVIPHVTQHDKADITELDRFRKKYSPQIEKKGGKLTVTSILVKVLEYAMKKYPQFNSSIDLDKHEIIYKNYFNIGIAVDTDFGLIVPNVKNVDKKNLSEISTEINILAVKARNKKIGLDDLQGGCITITNLGGIGGTAFTPIVNYPEVAILGVSRGSYEPVYLEGKFEPRLMLPLSLSYDHRIIDGADAARFLRFICEVLEDPLKLLL